MKSYFTTHTLETVIVALYSIACILAAFLVAAKVQ